MLNTCREREPLGRGAMRRAGYKGDSEQGLTIQGKGPRGKGTLYLTTNGQEAPLLIVGKWPKTSGPGHKAETLVHPPVKPPVRRQAGPRWPWARGSQPGALVHPGNEKVWGWSLGHRHPKAAYCDHP